MPRKQRAVKRRAVLRVAELSIAELLDLAGGWAGPGYSFKDHDQLDAVWAMVRDEAFALEESDPAQLFVTSRTVRSWGAETRNRGSV